MAAAERITELEQEIYDCNCLIKQWEDEGRKYTSMGYRDTAQAKYEYARNERKLLKSFKAELRKLKAQQATRA